MNLYPNDLFESPKDALVVNAWHNYHMDRVKKVLLFSLPILSILTLTGLAGYASNTATSTPVSTSESRMAGGFSFTVNVSNTHPRLGENIIISADLQNVYNTSIPVQELGGTTTIQITNVAGEIVWGRSDFRSGTTLTVAAGVGWNFGFSATWMAGNNPDFTIPVTAGTYTLSASNNALSLSVTPIQIVVTN